MNGLARKIYTARRIFLKPPGLFSRIKLYRDFRKFAREWAESEDFNLKIRDVCSAPDNSRIPRVGDAGKVLDGYQIMHNGVKVLPNSYVGSGMTGLLEKNRGVHEPQEELAFAWVLDWLKAHPRNETPTMIELGSYWAFYSLWFHTDFPNARSYCVEPAPENLEFGKGNFAANAFSADFTQAFVGSAASGGEIPTISVDSLMAAKGIPHVTILHADIQGYELEMLKGASQALVQRKVDFVFVSSHSNFLHYRCIDELEKSGFQILAEADLLETFSSDGVIVAGRRDLPDLKPVGIAKRN